MGTIYFITPPVPLWIKFAPLCRDTKRSITKPPLHFSGLIHTENPLHRSYPSLQESSKAVSAQAMPRSKVHLTHVSAHLAALSPLSLTATSLWICDPDTEHLQKVLTSNNLLSKSPSLWQCEKSQCVHRAGWCWAKFTELLTEVRARWGQEICVGEGGCQGDWVMWLPVIEGSRIQWPRSLFHPSTLT